MTDQEKLRKLEELRKQRDELDRLISELSAPEATGTNIPYTKEFLSAWPPREDIALEKYDPKELLQIKMFVNKKCNQISTDYGHTSALVRELMPYREHKLFIELFARRLIEQGRVQVSAHLESYKPLGYVLVTLDCERLVQAYFKLAMARMCGESEIRGIYAIYFGYLNLKEDHAACWFWLAGILNCLPNGLSGYVLEAFLLVCGEMMHEKCGLRFLKILRYIKKHYLQELQNRPVETRIASIIANYDREIK